MSFFSTANLQRCSSRPRQGAREQHYPAPFHRQLPVRTHLHTLAKVGWQWEGRSRARVNSVRGFYTAVRKSGSKHRSESSRKIATQPLGFCRHVLILLFNLPFPPSLFHTHTLLPFHVSSVNSPGSGFMEYEENLNSSTVAVPLKYLLYKHSTPPSLEAASRICQRTLHASS